MKKINITEKYTLCMLKEKKTLHEKELTPYLIVSMIVEMMLNDNLEVTDKNKVILSENRPTESYNIKLYDIIKDMNKEELSLRYILSSICYSFSSKKLKSIISELENKMIEDKLISLEDKKGLFGIKKVIKINEDEFSKIIEKIKNNLLEKGKLTDELVLIASLLNSTRFLKNIFNKYEKEKLNERLEEIKNSDIAKKVKVAQSVISNMSAIITVMIINASTPV